jgi:alkaline phosphatase
MKLKLRKSLSIFTIICIVSALLVLLAPAAQAAPAKPQPRSIAKNVILMIADGAGFNQMLATDYYQYGRTGMQVFQRFPVKAAVSTYEYEWKTYSEDGLTPLTFAIQGYDPKKAWTDFNYAITTNPLNPAYINNSTDSASSATAMATGSKTKDGALGVDVNGSSLPNIIEFAEKQGKATGVVTTVPISHATPGGFVVHNADRNKYTDIAKEMIYSSAVDVIFGCGASDFDNDGKSLASDKYKYKYIGSDTWADIADDSSVAGADANGDGITDNWSVIRSKTDFRKLALGKTPNRVLGIPEVFESLQYYRSPAYSKADAFTEPFIETVPSLSDMSNAALNVLDNDKDGFFLMIEGGAVDWAGHFYQPGRMIEEYIDFNNAVQSVVNWVNCYSNWGETLLIVTADHETGYLWGPESGPDSKPQWNPVTNNGRGNMPGMRFYSDIGGFAWHSNSLVPFFAKGSGSMFVYSYTNEFDPVRGFYLDNTEINKMLKTCLAVYPFKK